MKTLVIEELIANGSFFMDWSHSEKLKFIKVNCSESYGDEIVIHSFDFEFYTVYFNYNTNNDVIENEQVEFFHNIMDSQDINFIFLSNFLSIFQSDIESVYSDEDEDVVFLKNGVDVYFNETDNERLTQKITSRSDMSREFVRKTLTLRASEI